MSRLSRGCLRCRKRKVKCDEGRPSCNRCIQRGELCEGYRDESSLIFRYENKKVEQKVRRRASDASIGDSWGSSNTFGVSSPSSSEGRSDGSSKDGSQPANALGWLKNPPTDKQPSEEDQAVDKFFEEYVMYPANKGSSPGFLEHLPIMFNEVPINNKVTLRWAVRAAAFAATSKEKNDPELFEKAMKCYGLSLSSLSKALRSMGPPDDFILMTVVVLDIFESIHLGTTPSRIGQHAEGMKQILRLRGQDQMYSPRGWSLFRLSHHRIQQQQLTHRQEPMEESAFWLDSLNDELPEVQIERANHEVVKICDRAKQLLGQVNGPGISTAELLKLIHEIHDLDQLGTTWRRGPNWDYKTISRRSLPQEYPIVATFPMNIQLHSDVWIAYEWNYYRTARIMMHTRLLELVSAVSPIDQPEIRAEVEYFKTKSRGIIQNMVDEILATVPQSLGDIDKAGNLILEKSASAARGVGAYFLLWPAKTAKHSKYVTVEQQQLASAAIERIREVTGMKQTLGELSVI